MKRIGQLTATLAAGVLIFSSCGGTPEHASLLPTDANMVATIDIGSMKDKATDLDAIIGYLSGDKDETGEMILNSGVSLDQKAYVFGSVKEEGPYAGGIFLIDDRAKLEATLLKLQPSLEITDDGEYRVASSGRREVLVMSETVGVFISADNGAEEATTIAKGLFTQEESLLDVNDNFKESTDNDFDIAMWSDLGSLKDVLGMMDSDLEIINEEIDLTDSYVSGGIAFNDGSVDMEASFIGGENASKLIAGVGKEFDADVANQVAGETLIAAAAFGIDIDKLLATIDEKDKGEELDEALAETNMTREQLTSIFSGDIAAGLNNVVMGMFMPEELSFSAAIGIKDKEGAIALVEQFAPLAGLEKEGDLYTSKMFTVRVNDDAIMIGGWNEFGAKAVNGEAGSLGDVEALENGISSFYLDFNKIPEKLTENMARDMPFVTELSTVKFSTSQDDNVSTATATISLNSDENAIKVLAKAFQKEEAL